MINNKPNPPKQTTITESQVGVVGDHAHIEGGIHFHRQVIVYDGVKPVSAGALLDACQAQVASEGICSRRCCNWLFGESWISSDLTLVT